MIDEQLLEKAKHILSSGEPLPVDVEASLMEQGVDVVALRENYEM